MRPDLYIPIQEKKVDVDLKNELKNLLISPCPRSPQQEVTEFFMLNYYEKKWRKEKIFVTLQNNSIKC